MALTWDGGVRVGLAYNAYVPPFLRDHSAVVDYVEVPFELLRHDPSVVAIKAAKPIVLHCASMSIAGAVPPSAATVDAIADWAAATETPWIGEHLSFVTADSSLAGDGAEPYAPGEPYNIGYTVSPPMNEASVATVLRAIERCHARFDAPLLLENPPIYFAAPTSTMSQMDFIRTICDQSSVDLLLDVAHLYITSQNTGVDPFALLDAYPADRVVEAHISGVCEEEGGHWDSHASAAPPVVHDLLMALVERAPSLKAVTLEYNWSSRFPRQVLLDEIERVRTTIASA